MTKLTPLPAPLWRSARGGPLLKKLLVSVEVVTPIRRRQPKPTSRMVAPSAVYFFGRTDGRAFGEAEARALWLAAVGARMEEGFGRITTGIWQLRWSKR